MVSPWPASTLASSPTSAASSEGPAPLRRPSLRGLPMITAAVLLMSEDPHLFRQLPLPRTFIISRRMRLGFLRFTILPSQRRAAGEEEAHSSGGLLFWRMPQRRFGVLWGLKCGRRRAQSTTRWRPFLLERFRLSPLTASVVGLPPPPPRHQPSPRQSLSRHRSFTIASCCRAFAASSAR